MKIQSSELLFKHTKPYNVTKKVLDTLLGLLLGGGVTAESKVISDTGLMYRDFIENVAKEIFCRLRRSLSGCV